MKSIGVVGIEVVEDGDTYDVWNFATDAYRDSDLPEGNFLIGGVVVHNSIPDAVKNRDDNRGLWQKKLHPIILDVLKDTYGVIVYQEQLQSIWQRVAGFTAPEAQEARKAVAKKHTHKFKPIQEKWLTGASRVLGRDEAERWWPLMETFGRYAFNKCLDKDTILTDSITGEKASIEEWSRSPTLPTLPAYDNGVVVNDRCVAIHDTGVQEVFEITFDNGQTERVTMGHKFLCSDGHYHEVREIIDKGLDVVETRPGESNNAAEV